MNRYMTAIVLMATCFCLGDLRADPAAPLEIEVSQPGGTRFKVIPRGDEYANWTETSDGHSVVRKNDTWFYAEKDDAGRLSATSFRVGDLSLGELQAMPLNVRPKPDRKSRIKREVRKISTSGFKQDKGGSLLSSLPAPHTQRVLTVLVDYSDQTFTYTDASVRALIYGGGFSVRKFYLENSYGRFNIVAAMDSFGTSNDGIVHIARATTHPNQADDHDISEVEAREIVALTDAFIDYAAYDTNADGTVSSDELSILIVLAGYATSYGGIDVALTPNVWPHASGFDSGLMLDGVTLRRYTMTGEAHATTLLDKHQATIGTMSHELGHLSLNLPDLYDTDGSSEGIGRWGLMGNAVWNQTGIWAGDRPGHMSAWSKVVTNFTIPQDINNTQSNVSISKADKNETTKRIWIDKYKRGEFFLIENRQRTNFDAGLPGSGLLIWHADDQQVSNTNESRKWVDVEEADGQMHLDSNTNRGDMGDPFPGISDNTSFNNTSTPNSRSNAGAVTQIGVTGISASSSTMTANISIPTSGRGDNVSYLGSGIKSNVGYDETTVWAGIRALNDTEHNTFDGVDVHVNDDVSATIDVLFYTNMAGGKPTGLIHTQTGFAAVPGWNRLLLTTPQSFPVGTQRGVVLKIVNDSYAYPVSYIPGSVGSGRSYINSEESNGTGTFFQLCPSSFCGEINLATLLSTPSAGPPARPTNIKATDGTFPDKVRVTFNPVDGATVYRVFRCTTNVGTTCGTPVGFPKVGSFNDTKGTVGIVYFYRVRACNDAGCSPFSVANTGSSSAAPAVPGRPTNIKATDGTFSDKVRVTFNPVTGATVYRVFRCTTSSGSTCGTPTGFPKTGTYDDTKGITGVVYFYRVRACNAAGCGPFSVANVGSRKAIPARPVNIRASDGAFPGRVRITWNRVNDATVYRLFRCPTTGPNCGLPVGFPKNPVFDDFKGTTGVVFYYRVRACTKTGNTTVCSLFSVANPGHRGNIPTVEIDALNGALNNRLPVATPIPVLNSVFGRSLLILMMLGFGLMLIKRRYIQTRE